MSTIYNFSLFLDGIEKKIKAEQHAIKVMSEAFDSLNDSTTIFGHSIVSVHHKLKSYEVEKVKRTATLHEL